MTPRTSHNDAVAATPESVSPMAGLSVVLIRRLWHTFCPMLQARARGAAYGTRGLPVVMVTAPNGTEVLVRGNPLPATPKLSF